MILLFFYLPWYVLKINCDEVPRVRLAQLGTPLLKPTEQHHQSRRTAKVLLDRTTKKQISSKRTRYPNNWYYTDRLNKPLLSYRHSLLSWYSSCVAGGVQQISNYDIIKYPPSPRHGIHQGVQTSYRSRTRQQRTARALRFIPALTGGPLAPPGQRLTVLLLVSPYSRRP